MALSPWFRVTDSDRVIRYEPGLFDVQLFLDFDVHTEFAKPLMSTFGVVVIDDAPITIRFDALEVTGRH